MVRVRCSCIQDPFDRARIERGLKMGIYMQTFQTAQQDAHLIWLGDAEFADAILNGIIMG